MRAKSEVKEKGMRSMRVLVAKICVAFALICLMQAAPVQGAFIGPIVIVQAATDQGTAEWRGVFPDLPDQVPELVTFKLAEKVPLVVPGVGVIGQIESLDIVLNGDPAVDLAFEVTTGNFPTTFTITSAVVSFPTLTNTLASASAAISIEDGVPPDGGKLEIVSPRTGLYKAEYNGSTLFAELLGSVNLPSGFGTATTSSSTGSFPLGESVDSIQSSFAFELSARDKAMGTSKFEVTGDPIPEPATAALLVGFGGLTMLYGYPHGHRRSR